MASEFQKPVQEPVPNSEPFVVRQRPVSRFPVANGPLKNENGLTSLGEEPPALVGIKRLDLTP
jgi:hypothetical protein